MVEVNGRPGFPYTAILKVARKHRSRLV